MDMKMIKHVCGIVNNIDDPEKAYDEAIEYLHIIGDMETSPYHHQTIALIEKYLEKGSHPSEGMADIYTDESVKKYLKKAWQSFELVV